MCSRAQPDTSADFGELIESLLPRPRSAHALDGLFELAGGMPVRHDESLQPPELAAVVRFRDLCEARVGVRLGEHRAASGSAPGEIVLKVTPESPERRRTNGGPAPAEAFGESARAAQGYRLRITPERVELVGRSSAGLSYGLQTLGQIARRCGRRWPGLEIDDAPDFALRGLSLDVSRGKVPTLDTLKELADRLTSLKANHLQLYVEHTFAFRFNPNIGRDCSPLTADEIRVLDAYCAGRRIELVPSLASFGHMGFVLALPEYRHLAEVEAARGWWETSWAERMHGLTLDVTNPESRELLESMYDEFLPLFSSRLANVCCDETYDLGRGKSRRQAERVGVGELYLEHLGFLEQLCRRHGKRLMFWGDIVKKHPELAGRVPKDTIVLDWDYAPDADYDRTALFTGAGLTTVVCPGTAGWNHVLNDINAAELNIRRFAAAGRKHGVAGLLNTDWGDEGHVNLLAGSWHPIALGAALAWNSGAPPSEAFDRAFGNLFFGDAAGEVVGVLRNVAAATDLARNWPEFCKPLADTIPRETLSDESLAEWRSVAAAAAERLSHHPAVGECDRRDIHELAVACRLAALLGERFEISRELAARVGAPDRGLAQRLARFADACEAIVPDYEAAWLARNKRSCLHEVTRVFKRHASAARELAKAGNSP